MMGELLNRRSRDDIIGIDELLLRLIGLSLRHLDSLCQLRAHPHTDVGSHVRDEARRHHRLVLIRYRCTAHDVGRAALGSTEQRERWGE